MKKKIGLEEFVKANREEFDNLEPSPQVWGKIQNDTKKTKVIKLGRYFTRVAAVVVLIVISSVLIIKNDYFRVGDIVENQNPEIKELIEAEAFYAYQVNGKLQEIRKCYNTFPEIKEEIENDLNELESMYKMLRNDLNDNVSNKAVIEAMIENSRYRLKLVDAVLEQINC